MSTLAHEGNPKEDEITIGVGSVLSTAQLDVTFPYVGGVTVVPPEEVILAPIASSCSDVFEWAGENDNGAFLGSATGRDWLYLQETPASGNSRDRYIDQTLWLRINSTKSCYGALWQSVWPLNLLNQFNTAGQTIDWQVTFNGIIDGTPRAGPCVWLLDGTTKDLAELWAVVINMEANACWMCHWNNQSLASLTDPYDTMVAPNIGDRFELNMTQEAASVGFGSNGFYVTLYDSSNNVRDTMTYQFDDAQNEVGSQVRHAKMNIGFVSVGGEVGGKMEFKTVLGSYTSNSTTPYLEVINPS